MARNSQMEVSNNVSGGLRRSSRLATKAANEAPAEVNNKQFRRKQANPKKYVAPANRDCNNCDTNVSDADVNLFLNFLNSVAAAANASMRNPIVAEPPVAPRRSTRGRVVEQDGNNLRVTVNVDEKQEGGLRRSTRSTRNKNRYLFDEEDSGAMDDNDSLYEPNEADERDDDFEMDDLVDENDIVESDVEEPEEEVEAPARKRGRRASGLVNVTKELGMLLGISPSSRVTYAKDNVRKMLFDYMETKNRYTSKGGLVVKLNNDLKTVYKHDEPNDLVVVYKVVNSILKNQTMSVNGRKKDNAKANVVAKPVETKTAKPVEAVKETPKVVNETPVANTGAVKISKPLQKLLGKASWDSKESVRNALFDYMKNNNLYTKQKDIVKINDGLRTVYEHEESKDVVYKVVNSILKHNVVGEEGGRRNLQTWMSFLTDIRSRTSALVGGRISMYAANVLARDLYCNGFEDSKKVNDDLLKTTYNNLSNGSLRGVC